LEVFDGTTKAKIATSVLSPLFFVLLKAQLEGIKKLAEA
jgi:hypothetical protein